MDWVSAVDSMDRGSGCWITSYIKLGAPVFFKPRTWSVFVFWTQIPALYFLYLYQRTMILHYCQTDWFIAAFDRRLKFELNSSHSVSRDFWFRAISGMLLKILRVHVHWLRRALQPIQQQTKNKITLKYRTLLLYRTRYLDNLYFRFEWLIIL